VLHAARCKYRMQKRQKMTSGHHRATLSGHIFGTKECFDNQKINLLSSNTSSTGPDNMVNCSLLTAEIDLVVWGTPPNFNGFHLLATLLHAL